MIQVINIDENYNINIIGNNIELSINGHHENDWLIDILFPFINKIKKFMLENNGKEIHLERDELREFIHLVLNDTNVECINFTLFKEDFENIMLIIKERVGVDGIGEIYDKLEKK